MYYREFLGIIVGYLSGLAFSEKLNIESDSLLAVKNLANSSINILELSALATGFLSEIDRTSTSFSHVKREGNIHAHFLARNAIDFDAPLEWTRASLLMYPKLSCLIFIKDSLVFP